MAPFAVLVPPLSPVLPTIYGPNSWTIWPIYCLAFCACWLRWGRGKGGRGAFAGGNCPSLAAHQSQTLPAHNHTSSPLLLFSAYRINDICYALLGFIRVSISQLWIYHQRLCVYAGVCACAVCCAGIYVWVRGCVYLNTRQWIELTTVNPLKRDPFGICPWTMETTLSRDCDIKV